MPGPAPKPASQRRRRNKTSTNAQLRALDPSEIEVPDLPDMDGHAWGSMTLAWWADVWSSPMSAEWDSSDIHGLYLLAGLIDAFWLEPSTVLAAEIRLQRQAFGLSPIDRRRLQWEIDRGEDADSRRRRRGTAGSGVPVSGTPADPRLRAL